MKTVLCFGDSNTWGYDPDATVGAPFPRRHAPDVRWTGVLARELGPDWRVIEEGQSGRTTVFEDPINPCRNGRTYLPAALESHQPIDVVVLMLGTNDLKTVFSAPVGEIAAAAGTLGQMVLRSTTGPGNRAPKLLFVAPPAVANLTHLPELDEKFVGAEARSLRFPQLYHRVARSLGSAFLNAQDYTTPSSIDGLHLDAASHLSLGRAIASAVRSL